MSYLALARKWRPKNFVSLIGQEHVAQALKNALDHNQLHHAYLFSGTRGSGKTTIARIFAKCLNCEKGVSSTPCDACDACKAIDEGRFLDLIEVDAASRTRVEETRELLDNVQYKPTVGRYKVYLIDEVHMLSNHSFNALLKTLEEPPEYVKFLLATTDPEKCPVTILSRCLQFHLKHMTATQITNHLETILKAEKIAFEKEALPYISLAAQGSMRDALSLLDQAIAYSNQNITSPDVKAMLGLIERDHVWNLLEDLHQKDGAALIKHIATLSEHTSNFDGALQDLLTALHHISIEQCVPGAINADYGDEQKIQRYAQTFTPEDVQLFYQIGLMGQRDLSLAPTRRLGFEMTLMRMLAFQIKAPLPIHETAAPIIVAAPAPITPITIEKKQTTASTPEIKLASISKPAPEWAELIPQLQLKGLTLSLANNCALKAMHDGKIELLLSKKHAALLNEKQTERIEEALTKHFGKPTTVNISIHEQTQHSPAAVLQRQTEEKHSKAHEQLANDPNLQNILEAFDTSLEADQVKLK